MEFKHIDELEIQSLPGRGICNVVGKNAVIESGRMTVGYGYYNEMYGPMEPHNHAEETIVVMDAKDSYVKWGNEKDKLVNTCKLEKGMILHFPPLEWHVFKYEEGGHLDIVFIYGQVDNIRPEQIN